MIKIMSKTKAKLVVEVESKGKRKRRARTVTYKNKTDLKKQYEEFQKEVQGKSLSEMTVEDLLDGYIANRTAMGIKETTIKGYKTSQKALIGFCGDVLASEVSAYLLEEFITEKINDEEHPLSPKTLRNIIGLLSAAYERAIRTDQLSDNPCRKVSMPKNNKKEIITFSEPEVAMFLNALDEERIDYKVGFELSLLCGLRRSEVLGLRESDIDMQRKCLSVRRTRHRVDRKDVVQTPKTARSERTLAIPDSVVEDIEDLIAKHHSFGYESTDYLIQDGFGRPMTPSAFSARVYDIDERVGLPPVSAHGLRHTFATMLNSSGIDIARISAELGHADIGITLKVYTHVFGNLMASSRGIADVMEKRIELLGTNTALMPNKKTAEA